MVSEDSRRPQRRAPARLRARGLSGAPRGASGAGPRRPRRHHRLRNRSGAPPRRASSSTGQDATQDRHVLHHANPADDGHVLHHANAADDGHLGNARRGRGGGGGKEGRQGRAPARPPRQADPPLEVLAAPHRHRRLGRRPGRLPGWLHCAVRSLPDARRAHAKRLRPAASRPPSTTRTAPR